MPFAGFEGQAEPFFTEAEVANRNCHFAGEHTQVYMKLYCGILFIYLFYFPKSVSSKCVHILHFMNKMISLMIKATLMALWSLETEFMLN